ncbi:MAG: hypothetical protein ACTMUB_10045 [cyanobacterium endosymbiont of Rhopalodia musculus]|uniref:hypothetical protein n=1 Tax=cyanobacterium endosymbiont of Epithemia clementina EcSB TaxID=3034674 RepID=UPI002480FFD9|nr:hypothetical protein [cyanobacterium endosymbiont of Epithemia clementina EcSB]WGT68371.1 hypothetical protein P3F56_04835 [cyanobacterium endosymbiont of Epithemia clementina EcSB]
MTRLLIAGKAKGGENQKSLIGLKESGYDEEQESDVKLHLITDSRHFHCNPLDSSARYG